MRRIIRDFTGKQAISRPAIEASLLDRILRLSNTPDTR
jgi:hypothetical protein